MNRATVTYCVETGVSVDEFRDVLSNSGLGERRPLGDTARLAAMLANANLILTARIDGKLVGIGARLIEELRQHLGPTVNLILSSVPEAVPFYQRIGMTALHDCFGYRRER